VNVQESNVNVQVPDVNGQEPDVNVQEPDVNVQEPDVNVQEPDVNVQEPDVNVQEPDGLCGEGARPRGGEAGRGPTGNGQASGRRTSHMSLWFSLKIDSVLPRTCAFYRQSFMTIEKKSVVIANLSRETLTTVFYII
jgi:hypothetical protein